jgi:hypothetical protein
MPTRKILIVMADRELQQLLVDFCAALAIATVAADSVASVGEILQRQAVSEVITDRLHGEWQHLLGLVHQQVGPIPLTLWAADGQDQRQAERLGVRFVDQNRFALPELVKIQTDRGGRGQQ